MFAENYKINKQQLTIEKQMLENKEIIEYELYDLMAALADLIKKNNVKDIEEIIKKYSKYINDKLIEYMYENQKIFFEFNYMLDVLKSELCHYEKDSDERVLLKQVQKELKKIYKLYNEKTNTKKQSPYFDIISYWLQSESNYLYIKELLKRQPDVYNCNNGNQHIVIYLLDQYIENFKKMIDDKNGTYINKNYIKEVYYLFIKSYKIRLKEEEKNEIDSKIKEFISYIKNTLIKEKRKNAAINEIKTMRTSNFSHLTNSFQFKEFSDDYLAYEQNRIHNQCINMAKDSLALSAFALGNNAYRISKNKNSIILKMFSIDVHSFVPKKTIMSCYFENCVFNQEEPDEFFTKNIRFNKNEKYPVLCYNLEFYPSGKIKSLSINKDTIMITDKYNTIYQKDENLKEIYNLYLKSVLKNSGDITDYDIYKINDHFEQLLNEKYIEFAQTNKLPLVYYGYSLPNKKEIEKNLSDLSTYFYRLDKKNTKEIINIIKSKIDQPHYSILPIENGVYDLKLIDSFNYFGIENQRMLSDLYFNQRQIEDPVVLYKLRLEYLNDYYEKVMEINETINYVDRNEIKETKGKIKRKLKI